MDNLGSCSLSQLPSALASQMSSSVSLAVHECVASSGNSSKGIYVLPSTRKAPLAYPVAASVQPITLPGPWPKGRMQTELDGTLHREKEDGCVFTLAAGGYSSTSVYCCSTI